MAYWYPLDWKWFDIGTENLHVGTEEKFGCIFINLNCENICENTKLILYLEDAAGNAVPANIYLSKYPIHN